MSTEKDHVQTSIGFEWITTLHGPNPNLVLDAAEVTRLDKDAILGKRHIAAIFARDRRFTAWNQQEAAKKLTRAVQDYVDYLRSVGAL